MDTNPLEDFIQSKQDSCTLIQWIGGNLKRFLLPNSLYQWVLFPTQLEPGYYFLALLLKPPPLMKRPSNAYAVLFAPKQKIYQKALSKPAGFGFHMTPAIASNDTFFFTRNVTTISTNFAGEHLIGVTTRDWEAGIEAVRFEVALLRENRVFDSGILRL